MGVVSAAAERPDPALPGVALLGLDEPALALIQALDQNRLHHAWLLTGPQGLGKAALAHRFARLLLGAQADRTRLFDARSDDPVARLVMAQAHPDFLVLDRLGPDGALRRSISVDEARRLPEFFSKAPAMSRYRVALVDAVDDLNTNAANAILKILEEPPDRGVLLLISHAPGRLLPTVRSRCRRLVLRPWPLETLAGHLVSTQGLERDEAEHLAAQALGSPGRALALLGAKDQLDDAAVAALLDPATQSDPVRLAAMADTFRGAEGGRRLSQLLLRLCDLIAERLRRQSFADPPASSRWAEVWRKLSQLPDEAEGLNLDRNDVFWAALAELRAATAAHPLGN
jgi:DNA polymerase-3 subunit delta'